MKVLLVLFCLTIFVEFSQESSKNETVPETSKKDAQSKSSKNETSKSMSSELLTNETEHLLMANETVTNETVNVINYQRARIAFSQPVNDGKCDQSDIANKKKKNPFLAKRFTDQRLAAICKRQHIWTDAIVQQRERSVCKPGGECGAAAPAGPQYTEAQRSLLTQIRGCKGIKCFEGRNATISEAAVSQEYILTAKSNVSRSLKPPSSKFPTETKASSGTKGKPGPQYQDEQQFGRVTRKEYRSLTDEERNAFHAALNAVKATMVNGVSKYDLLIEYHAPRTSPGAHFGCSFLPWHREFLKQLEVLLRYENAQVFLPYWDSSLDQGLPTPCDSVLYTDSFVGDSRGTVYTGPFSHWRTARTYDGSNDLSLRRDCGSQGSFYKQEDIDYLMAKDNFKYLCYCKDEILEDTHGDVHMYVGGYMAANDIGMAPNDPLFFMHHCFVDFIWEQWRQKNQNREQREKDYPPDAEACYLDYYADAPMKPFSQFTDIKNKDGLSNVYTDELYDYAPRPSCPDNCNGPYLFCSSKFDPPRCLPKIKLSGNCTTYEGQDVCDKGKCVYGKCESA